MAKRITAVVSQGQSNNPAKRGLEEDLVAALLMENGIDVMVVPHLYDLKPDGTGMLALHNIPGDMVVASWMYPRAARWVLDRNGIHGHAGETLLTGEDEDEDDDAAEAATEEEKERVIDQRKLPNRKIYCLDLRVSNRAADYVEEVKRIAAENKQQVVDLIDWVGGKPDAQQMQRFLNPTNDTAAGGLPVVQPPATPGPDNGDTADGSQQAARQPLRVEDTGGRRWYPVIDFSRCTNCMECIDFCLFGVYGVDGSETILVEQPDNCRKGCPACSRVCPENAIIFPQHKTPAIAGSAEVGASLKIDLSKLFGAPEEDASAVDVAVRERDEQLVAAGREAVGDRVGMPRRQADQPQGPKDELDNLIDQLDEMDL